MTGVLVIGGNYFYKLAIDTGTSKASVFKSKDNMENSKSAQKETLREKNDKEWFFKNSNYSDVFIK